MNEECHWHIGQPQLEVLNKNSQGLHRKALSDCRVKFTLTCKIEIHGHYPDHDIEWFRIETSAMMAWFRFFARVSGLETRVKTLEDLFVFLVKFGGHKIDSEAVRSEVRLASSDPQHFKSLFRRLAKVVQRKPKTWIEMLKPTKPQRFLLHYWARPLPTTNPIPPMAYFTPEGLTEVFRFFHPQFEIETENMVKVRQRLSLRPARKKLYSATLLPRGLRIRRLATGPESNWRDKKDMIQDMIQVMRSILDKMR